MLFFLVNTSNIIFYQMKYAVCSTNHIFIIGSEPYIKATLVRTALPQIPAHNWVCFIHTMTNGAKIRVLDCYLSFESKFSAIMGRVFLPLNPLITINSSNRPATNREPLVRYYFALVWTYIANWVEQIKKLQNRVYRFYTYLQL
jgi:hypothetical protein